MSPMLEHRFQYPIYEREIEMFRREKELMERELQLARWELELVREMQNTAGRNQERRENTSHDLPRAGITAIAEVLTAALEIIKFERSNSNC